MAYWVKIEHQRKDYVVNFDRINTFCCEKNGRITFWLPNTSIAIVVSPHSNLQDYQKIVEYLDSIKRSELENAYWVKLTYERNEYVINLNSISSFCCEANGRLTFWLPDIKIPIIINPVSNPESYDKVIEYLQQKTGYSLSGGET